jgi:CBS domain-containing protein
MQVKEIMTHNVEPISSDASLVEAGQKMKSLEIGALPVGENDMLMGMIVTVEYICG